MKHKTTTILCATMLLVGTATGTLLSSMGLLSPTSAHAQPAAATEATPELPAQEALFRGSRHLAEIARRMTPSVVHIQSTHQSGERTVEETGSGVLVTSDVASGVFIATNWHVVDGAKSSQIDIHLHDGRVLHPSRIWKDPETDIAVLKIEETDVVPAQWGDSSRLEMGHFVVAVGSPFGLSHSMTVGIISAKGRRSLRLGNRRKVLNQDFLQTDAAINPGNSGGPLIDLNNRVIGINTAIASNSGGNDGIGFSIPSNLVRRVMDQLLTKGRVSRSYLGVKLDADFNEETARRLKLTRVRGARVLEVYNNTPAAKSGLKFDDVVMQFNDIAVQDENHLINLVSLTPNATSVDLSVVRGGRTITVKVQLADRDDLVRRANTSQP